MLPFAKSWASAALAPIAVAVVIGAIVAANVPDFGGDFSYYWRALAVLHEGGNPYRDGFLYPFPTLLILYPFSWLNVHDGAVAFMAISSGLMAVALIKTHGARSLVLLASPAFWDNIWKLQFGPLLIAAALIPALGFLSASKATIGLEALLYRPNRWSIGGFAALVVVSLAILPWWPLGLYRSLPATPVSHAPPVWWPLGVAGLLGLLQWREPRGRVLLACTLIPANPQYYDHLLVWLAARDWRESLWLTVCAWIGYLAFLATAPHDLTRAPLPAQFAIAASVYLPAGVLMLRGARLRFSRLDDPVDAHGPAHEVASSRRETQHIDRTGRLIAAQ